MKTLDLFKKHRDFETVFNCPPCIVLLADFGHGGQSQWIQAIDAGDIIAHRYMHNRKVFFTAGSQSLNVADRTCVARTAVGLDISPVMSDGGSIGLLEWWKHPLLRTQASSLWEEPAVGYPPRELSVDLWMSQYVFELLVLGPCRFLHHVFLHHLGASGDEIIYSE